MSRYFVILALLALVAVPAIGCSPGEPEMPENPTTYDANADKLDAGDNTATMSLDDEVNGG